MISDKHQPIKGIPMRPGSSRLSALLGLLLISAWPALASAAGAFTLKGGVMNLWDDTQVVDGTLRSFDETSYRTFGIAWEHRRAHGASFGVEYLNYRNEFTPPSTPDPGLARTQVLQFVTRKYFDASALVHPFMGVGIGTSQTTVSFDTPTSFTKYDWNLALQVNAGVELRLDNNFALAMEVKSLYHDVSSSREYNPSATGVYLGMGFLF
jgi:opacity protein-like surface antigen